jgi:hypothetical protein
MASVLPSLKICLETGRIHNTMSRDRELEVFNLLAIKFGLIGCARFLNDSFVVISALNFKKIVYFCVRRCTGRIFRVGAWQLWQLLACV